MTKSFNQMADTDQFENLMLVDSLNLAFKFKHKNEKKFAAKFLDTVRSFARSYSAKETIILADYKGSKFRREVYPDYKANRDDKYKDQTEEEKQEFEEFISEYNKALSLLEQSGYLVCKYKGVEADDLAALFVDRYAADYKHTWLISTDKDWDLLIRPKVSRFSYITRKEIGYDNWADHYDYPVEHHISIKVLEGDKGDNVPGVAGVGPKRAASLIKQYGTALDIYDLLPIENAKYVYLKNLNDFKEQILVNYELMDLLSFYEEAIGPDNIRDIIEKYEQPR